MSYRTQDGLSGSNKDVMGRNQNECRENFVGSKVFAACQKIDPEGDWRDFTGIFCRYPLFNEQLVRSGHPPVRTCSRDM
jgi:hypothetical protein